MKLLIVDPFGGLSGDMLLGGLVDLGVEPDHLREALGSLYIGDWSLSVERTERRYLGCIWARFEVPVETHRRGLAEILERIDASVLPPPAKTTALRAFRLLAEAEAKVHRIPVEEVHFHEVGAADAILDICGVAWALHRLNVERILTTALPTGSGVIECAHGISPCPAPAVTALLEGYTLTTMGDGEMVTPTGAALLRAAGEPLDGGFAYRLIKTGYGAGARSNSILRLFLAEGGETHSRGAVYGRDEVLVLETHLDDAPPTQLAYLMERLFAVGALDVAYTPLVMKKGRPGVRLTVIVPPSLREQAIALIFAESPTLGIREQQMARSVLTREVVTVDTPWGPVRVKVAGGASYPEFEDCAAIARDRGLPLRGVYEGAMQIYGNRGTIP